ncbi:MAG: hypothetical protein LBS41_06685 [Streptococcaceae bacterium]|jgi:hypothetical protein|nr:hypothetical protein [Streptococcaceae bacterium]
MNHIFTLLAVVGATPAGQAEPFNGQPVTRVVTSTFPDNFKYLVGIDSYLIIAAVLGLLLFFLIKKNILKGHNKGIGIFVTAMALVVIGLIINAAIGNLGAI